MGEQGFIKVTTHRAPLGVTLVGPNRLSLRVTSTLVKQNAQLLGFTGARFSQSNNFAVSDLVLSYRLPQRRGLLSFGVKNLFAKDFAFQETDPATPRISKNRFVFGRVTLSF